MSKCPLCANEVGQFPAISRKDNKTKICSDCGVAEALADYFSAKKREAEKQVAEFQNVLNQFQGRWS
jgi:hypothetical protein